MAQIRLNSTESINSINRDSFLNIGLNHTTKPMPQMSIAKKVDQYEVYESEYNAANQYRVSITIRPYCTNVLYNMITEVLRTNITTGEVDVMVDNSTTNKAKRA